MSLEWGTGLDRRNILKATGGLACGTAVFTQVGSVSAQDDTASVTLNPQESAGDSIEIASLQTDVDARLFISPVRDEDSDILYSSLDLSAETSFTNRTVQLDQPIRESKTVSAVIQAGEDYDTVIADDTAVITVGESPEATRSSPTSYDTKPGVQKIEADPDAGFDSPYFLYTPKAPDSADDSVNDSQQRPLLVEIYCWGAFRNRVENARETIQGGTMRGVGDATNSPVLVAPLPFRVGSRFGLRPGTQVTDPRHERVDLQLLAMVSDAKSRLDGGRYTVADQIHFDGGSSAGVFIDSFAALHPERVSVFASGANGMAVLPLADLSDDIPTHGTPKRTTVPWPIGVADLDKLADTEFNREAWMEIDQFRWIGAEDQDPDSPGDYTHKIYKESGESDELVRDIFGSLQVDHRFETSREIYDHLGVPATFSVFEGAGHVPGAEGSREITEYHQQKIAEEFEVVAVSARKSADRVTVGEPLVVTLIAENHTAIETTTTATLTADEAELETAEIRVPPTGTETIEVETGFDEAGEYPFRVNGRRVGDPVTVTEGDVETDTGESPASESPSPDSPNAESQETTADDQPGFGVIQSVAALGGVGYLIKRRLSPGDRNR